MNCLPSDHILPVCLLEDAVPDTLKPLDDSVRNGEMQNARFLDISCKIGQREQAYGREAAG